MTSKQNNTQKLLNLTPEEEPVATPTPVTTDAINFSMASSSTSRILDDEKQRMVKRFLKYYQTLRNNEYFPMFRSNFVSQLIRKEPAEQYDLIVQHVKDTADNKIAKAWQLIETQFKETQEEQKQKVSAFEKIYQALYKGQTIKKPKNFVNTQLTGKNLTYEGAYDLIQQHLLQKPNSRTAYAWELAKQHYDNCNSDNIELLKNIYEYSFAHSRLHRARVGGQIFYSSSDLKKYLNNAKHQSDFEEKVAQIKSTPNQVPHTRLARIIAALEKAYTHTYSIIQQHSFLTP